MSYPADYHMHTPLCRHASGQPTEYAAQALWVGLDEIGFSDHSPMPQDDFDSWRMRLDQLDEYVESVKKARQDHPQLVIRLALEVDYLPGGEEWIRDLARRYPWDYLIGSVHYVEEGWDVDNPAKISIWKARDCWEVWSVYFQRLEAAAGSGLFQILGHADLPKKFNFYPQGSLDRLFAPFLRTASKKQVAIELNTAGLRKECKEIYPSQTLLQMAQNEGVPITFGSDSHSPEEVGMNFVEAMDWARRAGYDHYVRFSEGKSKVFVL